MEQHGVAGYIWPTALAGANSLPVQHRSSCAQHRAWVFDRQTPVGLTNGTRVGKSDEPKPDEACVKRIEQRTPNVV